MKGDFLLIEDEKRAKARRRSWVLAYRSVGYAGAVCRRFGISRPTLPADESKEAFIVHYGACSHERLDALATKPDEWFERTTKFFDVDRSHAWVLTRRIAHSAHHRGQLTVYLRLWGRPLYSTYGPTADTGGLAVNGARVVYYEDEPLPLTSDKPVSERPD